MIERERERERERQKHRQREKQVPYREPDVGLDPGTPGSCPGPKAGTEPLSHPGIPDFINFLSCYRLPQCVLLRFTTSPATGSGPPHCRDIRACHLQESTQISTWCRPGVTQTFIEHLQVQPFLAEFVFMVGK